MKTKVRRNLTLFPPLFIQDTNFMRHQHETRSGGVEDAVLEHPNAQKEINEQAAVVAMDLEKMLDTVHRDLRETFPTIAAIELQPKLLRALSLIHSLEKSEADVDDEERLAILKELNELRLFIIEKYFDWQGESLDALAQALEGKRKETFGTVVIPSDWESSDKPLQ